MTKRFTPQETYHTSNLVRARALMTGIKTFDYFRLRLSDKLRDEVKRLEDLLDIPGVRITESSLHDFLALDASLRIWWVYSSLKILNTGSEATERARVFAGEFQEDEIAKSRARLAFMEARSDVGNAIRIVDELSVHMRVLSNSVQEIANYNIKVESGLNNGDSPWRQSTYELFEELDADIAEVYEMWIGAINKVQAWRHDVDNIVLAIEANKEPTELTLEVNP